MMSANPSLLFSHLAQNDDHKKVNLKFTPEQKTRYLKLIEKIDVLQEALVQIDSDEDEDEDEDPAVNILLEGANEFRFKEDLVMLNLVRQLSSTFKTAECKIDLFHERLIISFPADRVTQKAGVAEAKNLFPNAMIVHWVYSQSMINVVFHSEKREEVLKNLFEQVESFKPAGLVL